MGSTEDSDVASEPVIHKFGDEELSDVTFVVGGEEFKCHKMTLASRSTYFKAMFYSNFKEKDQDKISIEADPVAFKWILELMYTGQFSNWMTHLSCPHAVHEWEPAILLWRQVFALLNLADQFDVLNQIVSMLENFFILCGDCARYGKNCETSGSKMLIALKYGMDRYKTKYAASWFSMQKVLEQVKDDLPAFSLDANSLLWILKTSQ